MKKKCTKVLDNGGSIRTEGIYTSSILIYTLHNSF